MAEDDLKRSHNYEGRGWRAINIRSMVSFLSWLHAHVILTRGTGSVFLQGDAQRRDYGRPTDVLLLSQEYPEEPTARVPAILEDRARRA